MSRRLPVSVGRDSPGAIEAPASFETTGTFGVEVDNQGRDVRVHVALDGDLASVASLPDNNYRVERGESLTVPVEVAADATHTGTLTVATGYGQEDHEVTVTLAPAPEETPVEPVPTAGRTDPDADRSVVETVADALDGGRDTPIGLLALAGVAVAVALVAATVVGGAVGLAGGVVVLVGVAAAGWLVLVGE